jgi:cytochrome c biogenesis protein CcmG/thiol:disulfide interchange protein DsbE
LTGPRRRAGLIAGLVVVLGIGGYFLFRPSSSTSPALGAATGRAAPLFESTDLQGRPVRLAEDRGHPVLVNFWASWCQPCRQEFPIFARLRADRPDVVILGVVFQDSDGNARRFMADHGATWPAVRDPNGQISGAYGVQPKPGIPQTFLISGSGRLVARHLGPFTSEAEVFQFLARS